MIINFRIDERLIHGQVITTWLKSLNISHLIVASDETAKNQIQQQALKLAVPEGVKCLIKSVDNCGKILEDPRCEPMRIMLIVGCPQDAVRILKYVHGVKEINLANFGSITKPDEKDKLKISGMVYLDQDDIKAVNQLIDAGFEIYTQKTVVEPKKSVKRIG